MSADAAANHPGFQPILLTLPSLTPSLALEVLPYGVTLHRLFVQADGKTHDVLIGPETPSDHLTQKYTNTIIGRYANRVPAGTHTVSRNGLTSTLTVQPNESPQVSLHGGIMGYDLAPWEPLVDPSQAKLFTQAEQQTIQTLVPSSIIFSRISPDGEEGFPGKLLIEVLVGLAQPQGPPEKDGEYLLGSVVLLYRAKLLEKGKVTPINLTQHWGFNLDASLQEGLSVKDHKLVIKADNTLSYLPNFLSAGSLAPVAGTHHAHAEKPTGKIHENFPPQGYDEFYVFADRPIAAPTRLSEAELTQDTDIVIKAVETSAEGPVVELEGAKSGLRLAFETNQSGVQFYTNNFSDPAKTARKKIHGGSGSFGDGYDGGSAAFLEFHEPLAAWLHPATHGPSKSDTLLASGELYNNFVRMDVWYKTPTPL